MSKYKSPRIKDINKIEENLKLFLKECYNRDLIRSKNNMEAIYCSKNAGGPKFVTGSTATI